MGQHLKFFCTIDFEFDLTINYKLYSSILQSWFLIELFIVV